MFPFLPGWSSTSAHSSDLFQVQVGEPSIKMNGSKEEAHQGLEMVLSFTCCEVGQLTKLLQAYLTQTLKLGQQLHHLHPEGGLQTASESALECLGNTSSHETCSSQAHV